MASLRCLCSLLTARWTPSSVARPKLASPVALALILLLALLSNFPSFLRVFVLLETLLLVAGLSLVSFSNASEIASTSGLFSALVVLTLAGTEAALSLALLVSLSLSLQSG